MEPYMTNGFHFTGPRLFRPRGPSPHQFRGTQLGYGQPRPMVMGHGHSCRFRFSQNNLKQFPMHNMWGPEVNNNGAQYQYHPQPCRFNMRGFEGPPSPPWNRNNQYRPQYFQNSPPRNHSCSNGPYHRNISLRGGGYRRPFLQGRNAAKISSGTVPEQCGTSHAPPPPSMSLFEIKLEPQDNSKEDLNEEVDDFICGNNAVPQENDQTQVASVNIKEADVGGTVGGDNPRVISMAVLIKQEKNVECESLNDVAVGSEACLKRGPSLTTCPSFKRIRGESGSDYSVYSSEEESLSPSDSQKVEEYEPENPAIVIRKPSDIFSASKGHCWYIKEGELISRLLICSNHMASRDEDGFDEACVGVCVSRYPTTLGRMMEVAGYGVWFSDENKSNFSGVLDSSRPQNLKAVMIHASSRALNAMKAEGYSKVRINLETEYLNLNVLAWIQKYMDDPKAESSNWDEFKYHAEILDLCAAAHGMIIKWSHCSETSVKKIGLCKANALARKATDAWMKDLQFREEAVGTS